MQQHEHHLESERERELELESANSEAIVELKFVGEIVQLLKNVRFGKESVDKIRRSPKCH